MGWSHSEVSTDSRSGASYAICCGRLYCAFTDGTGRLALAVLQPDFSWRTLPDPGPATGAVPPSIVASNYRLLAVFAARDGSDALHSATFDPRVSPPTWTAPVVVPGQRSAQSAGLVEHRHRVWCAAADSTSDAVAIASWQGGSWQTEPKIAASASAAPALVDVDGALHCMIPTGAADGGRVVDCVYDDEGTWHSCANQPDIRAVGGIAACVVDRVHYLAFGSRASGLSVVACVNGQWQAPEAVGVPSLSLPAITQFGNHLFIAGQDSEGTITSADQTANSLETWMEGLPDKLTLDRLSMPGTHDSCAMYGGVLAPIVQTQTMSLSHQFEAGVRWFDIRIGLNDSGVLEAHHGSIELRQTFPDILASLVGSVEAQPSEALFISIKDESGHDPAAFTAAVEANLARYRGRLEWTDVRRDVELPVLGDLRGKLGIVARSDLGDRTGLDFRVWPSSNQHAASFTPDNAHFEVVVEDDWNLSTLFQLDDKWTAIQAALSAVPFAPGKWHITFTSASSSSGLVWPIVAAEGVWPDHAIGLNNRLVSWLQAGRTEESVGTVVVDFPGYPQLRLCPQIIARNPF